MNRRELFDFIDRTENAKPVFPSLAAAVRFHRRRRDTLLKRLRSAAAKDNLVLDNSTDSLIPLEDWSWTIFNSSAFARIRMSPGELTDALWLYSAAVAVEHFAADWKVEESWHASGRFDLYLRQSNGSYQMYSSNPDDDTFWSGRKKKQRSENRLAEHVDSFRAAFLRYNLRAILPHRARLSPDPDRRKLEENLLTSRRDPWNEATLLKAFRLHQLHAYRQDLVPSLRDTTICGSRTRTELRRLFPRLDPVWQAEIIDILETHEGPAVIDLCIRFFSKTNLEPAPHTTKILWTLARINGRDALPQVAAFLDNITRRKRPHESAHTFRAAAHYLRRIGPRYKTVQQTLTLLADRRARLHPEEQTAFADCFDTFASPPTRGSGKEDSAPRRRAVTGKQNGKPVRRMLYQSRTANRAICFID